VAEDLSTLPRTPVRRHREIEEGMNAGFREGLLTPCRQNGGDEIFRDLGRQRRVIVFERALAKLHGLFVAGEVPVAVRAHPQVVIERSADLGGQFVRQVVRDEVGEFAAGHDTATSQKILIAPLEFCKRSSSSGFLASISLRRS